MSADASRVPLAALLDGLRDPVCARRPDGRLAYANRAFRERFGLSDPDGLPTALDEWLAAPERRVWQDGAARRDEQSIVLDGQAPGRFLRDTFVVQGDAGPVAVCSVLHEIGAEPDQAKPHEPHETHEPHEPHEPHGTSAASEAAGPVATGDALAAERAARIEAERIGGLRDEFLGLVSHDLRTPLNAMVGWLHVIESGRDLGEQVFARALAGLGRAVRQQRELVDTLLETARALRGDLALSPEPVDARALLEAALAAQRERTPALRASIAVAEPLARLQADAQRLRYVFDELLGHAARFAELGTLEIAIEASGPAGSPGRVAFRFDDAAADAAWEPFRARSADAASARRRSIGIGLVLAQRIVELSGGRLQVLGAAPARLEMQWPTAHGPDSAAGSERPAAELLDQAVGQAALDRLDVMIVDDQSEMREVLSTLLSQSGARVHVAASAAEGAALYVERVLQGGLDLGVLDIAMPVEDGIGLVRRIREQERLRHWPRRPMIALTAHASPAMREQALDAGFDQFLAKPLLPDDLYRAIAVVRGLAARS